MPTPTNLEMLPMSKNMTTNPDFERDDQKLHAGCIVWLGSSPMPVLALGICRVARHQPAGAQAE